MRALYAVAFACVGRDHASLVFLERRLEKLSVNVYSADEENADGPTEAKSWLPRRLVEEGAETVGTPR
jgi:hypothetical protein